MTVAAIQHDIAWEDKEKGAGLVALTEINSTNGTPARHPTISPLHYRRDVSAGVHWRPPFPPGVADDQSIQYRPTDFRPTCVRGAVLSATGAVPALAASAPPAPTNVSATTGATTATLSWALPTSTGGYGTYGHTVARDSGDSHTRRSRASRHTPRQRT